MGDHKGLQNIINVSLFMGNYNSKPSGKGERLIILHAGGKDGWIPGKHYFSAYCIQYANTKLLSKAVIGSLSQKKGLQTIMKRWMPPALRNGLKKSCSQACLRIHLL